MRPYEVMVILEPALEESAVQQVINRSTELLTSRAGTVNRVEKWGKRRLAYELNHRTEGYYVLFDVTSESAPMDELDRALRLADDVMRHKIVRIPEQAAGRKLPGATTPTPVAEPEERS
jgi:small subunit ribosomal protein S6